MSKLKKPLPNPRPQGFIPIFFLGLIAVILAFKSPYAFLNKLLLENF